jgi:magnesium transporter
MQHLSDTEKWKLLVSSDINQAASEFGEKTSEEAKEMADELGVSYMVEVISTLSSDAAAEVLRNLPEDFRQKVIAQVPEKKRAALNEILSYPLGTAGALMTKEYLAVPLGFSVRQATEYLQRVPSGEKGKVSYIYVVDDQNRLEGVIQVRDLIFHDADKPIREILKSPVVQVETGTTQMDVVKLLQRHHYLGLPVVDTSQRLTGVISADNAMQVLQEETTDDIAKLVGTSAQEVKADSITKIVGFRLPWLGVNIASGIACAFISGIFQNSFEAVATLFLFVPVVLGLSESTGVQNATIVVRNLSLGHTDFRQLGGVFLRESSAGAIIGLICGLIVGNLAWLWKSNPAIGLALAGSMTLAIIFSALIGLVLPIFFKRLKIDPAIASGPLVLAICDIQTLFVYFNFSGAILRTL